MKEYFMLKISLLIHERLCVVRVVGFVFKISFKNSSLAMEAF